MDEHAEINKTGRLLTLSITERLGRTKLQFFYIGIQGHCLSISYVERHTILTASRSDALGHDFLELQAQVDTGKYHRMWYTFPGIYSYIRRKKFFVGEFQQFLLLVQISSTSRILGKRGGINFPFRTFDWNVWNPLIERLLGTNFFNDIRGRTFFTAKFESSKNNWYSVASSW